MNKATKRDRVFLRLLALTEMGTTYIKLGRSSAHEPIWSGRKLRRNCVSSRRISDIVRQHHVIMPSAASLLLKTLVMLEGTARLLSPTFSLNEVIAPFTVCRKQRADTGTAECA